MAISTGTYSTSPNTIKWAGADTDPYDRATQMAGPVENFDAHDHSSGKCLPVARVNATEVITLDHTTTGSSLSMTNTNGGSLGVQITTVHASASPAANDVIFRLLAQGRDAGANAASYGTIDCLIADTTDGSEDALWRVIALVAGASTTLAEFGANGLGVGGAPTFSNGAGLAVLKGATSTVRLESTGSGGTAAEIYYDDSNLVFQNINASRNFRFASGAVYVNDTSNAQMTTGVTINQDAADDEILAFKSSDVAHGMTALAETDTYGLFKKAGPNDGGLLIDGLSDANLGVHARALVSTAPDTTKTTAAQGAIMLQASLKSGTGGTSVGADGNLLVVRNHATARFILDAEGSAHADVEWTTFDTHDDVALLDSLEHALDPTLDRDPIRDAFGNVLRYNRDALQAARIVNFYDDGPRAMVNTTRLAMLHTGSIRQLYDRLTVLAAEVAALKSHLALEEAG